MSEILLENRCGVQQQFWSASGLFQGLWISAEAVTLRVVFLYGNKEAPKVWVRFVVYKGWNQRNTAEIASMITPPDSRAKEGKEVKGATGKGCNGSQRP